MDHEQLWAIGQEAKMKEVNPSACLIWREGHYKEDGTLLNARVGWYGQWEDFHDQKTMHRYFGPGDARTQVEIVLWCNWQSHQRGLYGKRG
jgi:hypothetical protein